MHYPGALAGAHRPGRHTSCPLSVGLRQYERRAVQDATSVTSAPHFSTICCGETLRCQARIARQQSEGGVVKMLATVMLGSLLSVGGCA